MRPTPRTPLAALMAASALVSLAPSRAGAGHTSAPHTGIIVDMGTVQPVGDPMYFYNFDVVFKPDPAVNDFIQTGDNFTINLTGNNGLISGTNSQPSNGDWAATTITASSVTWTFIGVTPITVGQDLDPVAPFFGIESTQLTTGTFTYTFNDSVPPGVPGGNPNSGGGSFTVTGLPEPSSLVLVGLGAPIALHLLRRSRRRARRLTPRPGDHQDDHAESFGWPTSRWLGSGLGEPRRVSPGLASGARSGSTPATRDRSASHPGVRCRARRRSRHVPSSAPVVAATRPISSSSGTPPKGPSWTPIGTSSSAP